MSHTALLVLTLGVLALGGCTSSLETSPIADGTPGYADRVSSADDDTGQAQEPLDGLSLACLLLVSVAVEIGCNEAVIDGLCPAGTAKTIHDTIDKTKSVTISCDTLRSVVCGGAAAGSVEAMRSACLAA